MKKVCLLAFLFLGCEQEDTETMDLCADTVVLNEPACQTFIDVTSPCIIQEVLTTINGNQLEKHIYHFDGSHYNKIESYYRSKPQDDYPVLASETVTLIYEEDKIKEVVIQPSARPGTQKKYNFDYKGSEVNITFNLIEDGKNTFTNSYNQLFVTNPNDSIYLSEGYVDILREYKNGNNTRFAIEAKDGVCVINNQKWTFTVKMSHDSNPNVFKDYAVRFPLGGGEGYAKQFWFGNNKNNIIANLGLMDRNETYLNCYTFLRNGNQVWIKNFELSDAYYQYSYKYSCE